MITLVILLNLLLGIICITFIVKNLVVRFKGSESGIKNMVFLGFLIVSLFCALAGAWQGSAVKQSMDYLEVAKDLDKDKIQYIEKEIDFGKNSVAISTTVGYGCLCGAYLMFRNIQKEISDNIGKPKKKWIWSDIENKK